jgi:2-dehydro-3-deoxyphosphogluconate aldolase/(4S)-4-hydroxy-2-oxoglutarate aldolase
MAPLFRLTAVIWPNEANITEIQQKELLAMQKVSLDQIYQSKIVAIIRRIDSSRILDTVAALINGGITMLEVTFDQSSEAQSKDTLKSIGLIKKQYGNQVGLGAGTVMSVAQVREAVAAGAEYIISPNVNPEVIRETKQLKKISIPGAFTPSEAANAYSYGADLIKIFPADVVGVKFFKALAGPLGHIPLIAVGGVNAENCDQFIKAGAKGVGIGGNLVNKKLIEAGQYEQITALARAYTAKLNG